MSFLLVLRSVMRMEAFDAFRGKRSEDNVNGVPDVRTAVDLLLLKQRFVGVDKAFAADSPP
jgi:hypothetical protein